MVSNQLAVLLSSFAFLGSCGLAVVLMLAWGWAARTGNRRLARGAGFGIAGLAVAYVAALVGFGLLSSDSMLPAGSEKYFCEIDCHLAYSVVGVRTAEGVRGATGPVWAVALRTRFDETTISARRGREAPLWPAPRHVSLRDTSGGFHEPVSGASEWLARQQIVSTPLTQELRPGDSYLTMLLFELPAGAAPAALLVEDSEWIGRVLIGDERSPWHGKVLLPLPPAGA